MGVFLRSFVLAAWASVAMPSLVGAQELGDYIIVPAAEIGARGVVQGGAMPTRQRVDRSIVSPFESGRRVVVRPAGLEEVTPVPALASVPVPASPVLAAPAANYINIGTLDAPLSALPEPVPEAGAQFIDIGPYQAETVPVSSF